MEIQCPSFDPKRTEPIGEKDVYEMIHNDFNDSACKNGEKIVVLNVGRWAWQYLPGQRSVKLAPAIAYDTLNPTDTVAIRV